MSQKPQIRILKRGRQADAPKPAETRAAREKDSRRGARAVAENVSSWVEECRERRAADAGRTFASLFAERAATLNSPA
jgi:hypothetical protein